MMKKAQGRPDEFAFILLVGLIIIMILTIIWGFGPGDPRPILEPTSFKLTIQKGASYSFFIDINGSSPGRLSNVSLTPRGEITNWLSFDKNNLDIENSDRIKVTVKVPEDVSYRTYTGSISVKSKGGEASVSLSIKVSNVTLVTYSSRPISLGDINVRYSVGSESLAAKENFEVSKSVFSQSSESLFVSIPSDKLSIITSGYIQLNIEKTNNAGNLIVLFNGREIFNQAASGNVSIPVDKSLINNTNEIVIKTTSSWLKFWSRTYYKIKQANFGADYQDILEREKTFDLESAEVKGFGYLQLAGRVKDYTSPLPELLIKINGQLVYSQVPPLALINQTLDRDILGNMIYVKTKDNRISFSFEEEASYSLDDVLLIVYYS